MGKHHKKIKNIGILVKGTSQILKKKYKCDVIWVIWNTILEESKLRDSNIQNQINSLYDLYLHNYIIGKKYTRLFFLYNSVAYLTHNINFDNIIKYDKILFIKTQLNVNKMYSLKKKNEINNHDNLKIKIKKIKKKKKKRNHR